MASATPSISLSSLTPSFSSLSFSSRISHTRSLYCRPKVPSLAVRRRSSPTIVAARRPSPSSSASLDDDDEDDDGDVSGFFDEEEDQPFTDEGDDDFEPSYDGDSSTAAPLTYSPFTGTKPSEEIGDMPLDKYVKMRLPGGFAAQQYIGTGRRKRAVARVVLQEGTGKVVINYRDGHDYMQGNASWLEYCKTPLYTLGYEGNYDIFVKAHGGGLSGQAQAISLGVARALLKIGDIHRRPLRKAGLLKRDSRRVERKKPGLKKARKAPQYSKR